MDNIHFYKKFRRFVLRKILIPIFRLISSIAFDKRYLHGKYFDASLIGWKWVWRSFWTQKILRFNSHVPWPVSPSIEIEDPLNIHFDLDDFQNFMRTGCYFSNASGGRIVIGKGTIIAPNVGLVTTNHLPNDISKHAAPKDIIIGNRCWLGMNSMILPGVQLGDNTIVAAGAVVTKSYPEGWCILAGVPARIIRKINRYDIHDTAVKTT